MCSVCDSVSSYSVRRNYNYDPTRTTVLRNNFVRASNRRFDHLASTILQAVDKDDVFGIKFRTHQSPGQHAFSYDSDAAKIRAFIQWLEEQIRLGVIEISDPTVTSSWLNQYIRDAYTRGVVRAREELRKAGYPVPTLESVGGVGALLQSAIHVDTLALLFIRTFEQLNGITSAMSSLIGQILTDGLLRGDSPAVLARKMVAAINGKGVGDLGLTDTFGRFIPARRRAEILARTEIIRAHHLANIAEYRSWGVLGVNVKAEFKTAGDERVCIECGGLEGKLFTLDEIEFLIPVHPQCRCVAIPIVVDDKGRRIDYGFNM